jgi:hypothetical protein
VLAAVSDGATNAFKSETWARRLVEAFASGELAPGLTNLQVAERLRPLASAWIAESPPRSATWFHRAFATQGSFATLLGLRIIRRGRAWRWTALGVGDSVLFVLDRDDHVVNSFPHRSLDSLMRDPMLVATRTEANSVWFHRPVRTGAWFPTGGSIVLATDAIARWVFEQQTAGQDAGSLLRQACASATTFKRFVAEGRTSGSIADDDTTVVWVDRR